MKILVLGADGFIGSNVAKILAGQHEVVKATRKAGGYHVDLTQPETIAAVLSKTRPEAIVNCAGVVENSQKAALNVTFTTNLLEQALNSGLAFKKIIILGSAAEYGIVDRANIPVREDVPLTAASDYAVSKMKETAVALSYREKNGLPVVVARVFNPIGSGMDNKFLIPRILHQVHEIRKGKRETLEISRLSSERDYINVKDVALALKVLIEGQPKEVIYNIGSGKSTSNQELMELILSYSKLPTQPKIIETSSEAEPLVATRADISRINNEFGWGPTITIEETVKEVINDAR